jgi:hypothetical protein
MRHCFLARVSRWAASKGARALDKLDIHRHFDLEHIHTIAWLRELLHVARYIFRLLLGKLDALFVEIVIVGQRL